MKNIVLIGMSGAGKSTIGVLLAKTLGTGFIDTDIIIQQKEGRTLQNIIDNDGIDAFLKIEESAICSLNANGCVIATGGSAVYSSEAMSALKNNGIIVYLKVSFDSIKKRLTSIVSRGIVIKPGKTLQEVFDEREPLYEEYCDLSVECTNLNIEHCVTLIVLKLGKATQPHLIITNCE